MATDRGALALPLGASAFAYSYRQSIYGVPVREELRVVGDRIVIERALSSDLRALEYYGWPGAAAPVGGTLEWRAPENAAERIVLVVAPGGEQRIGTEARSVVLSEHFGEDARVVVTAGRRPLLLWLWQMLPWR